MEAMQLSRQSDKEVELGEQLGAVEKTRQQVLKIAKDIASQERHLMVLFEPNNNQDHQDHQGAENQRDFGNPNAHNDDDEDDGDEDELLDRLQFFECAECRKPYYGGLRDCQMDASEELPGDSADEFTCPECMNARDSKHIVCVDAEAHQPYKQWKCRFCCSRSIYMCFGRVRYCASCHDDAVTLLRRAADGKLPQCLGPAHCPLGISHPPHGVEYPIGCGVCEERHLQTSPQALAAQKAANRRLLQRERVMRVAKALVFLGWAVVCIGFALQVGADVLRALGFLLSALGIALFHALRFVPHVGTFLSALAAVTAASSSSMPLPLRRNRFLGYAACCGMLTGAAIALEMAIYDASAAAVQCACAATTTTTVATTLALLVPPANDTCIDPAVAAAAVVDDGLCAPTVPLLLASVPTLRVCARALLSFGATVLRLGLMTLLLVILCKLATRRRGSIAIAREFLPAVPVLVVLEAIAAFVGLAPTVQVLHVAMTIVRALLILSALYALYSLVLLAVHDMNPARQLWRFTVHVKQSDTIVPICTGLLAIGRYVLWLDVEALTNIAILASSALRLFLWIQLPVTLFVLSKIGGQLPRNVRHVVILISSLLLIAAENVDLEPKPLLQWQHTWSLIYNTFAPIF
jgi:hypothetical protein